MFVCTVLGGACAQRWEIRVLGIERFVCTYCTGKGVMLCRGGTHAQSTLAKSFNFSDRKMKLHLLVDSKL
jgi:hypothetical protein